MIDVMTPTIRHEGIKIVAKCLERQTFQDFRWIVVDHDYDLNWYYENIPKSLWGKTVYLKPKVQIPERKYKLWNTRNTAYQFLERPLVVEIQDYHWFRSDTLIRFLNMFRSDPNSIVSDYYKIVTFKNYDMAMESDDIEDSDVEIIDATTRSVFQGLGFKTALNMTYNLYEMNVSSIPLVLLRELTPADEEMDNGYLSDTQYLSIPAMLKNYTILIDGDAKVYSFEHKLIEQRPIGWRTDAEKNQNYLVNRYGSKISEWEQGKAA